MKVVQALPALDGGGVEQGVLEIGRALVAAGHESVVASRGGRLVETLEREGSRHVVWDIGRKHPATLLRAAGFRRWLARERPAIVHARSRLPAWACYLAWRTLPAARRPRFVTTVHGLYSVSAYSAVMTRGERVIVVSDTARRYVADNYPGVDPARITRIYRGVDAVRYRKGFRPDDGWLAGWRREHPELVGKRVVLLPGRVTRLKGHHDFVDALSRLRETHDDVAGLVVGGVDAKHRGYADEVRRRAPELVFAGHRGDLREIMATAAAVVSLSTHPESFGRTVLESLSLGVPVVGYDHGGVGEVLARVFPQGRAPVGDNAAVAARLAAVLGDEAAARRAIGDHGFRVERMCAETLAVYEELAAGVGAASQPAALGRSAP